MSIKNGNAPATVPVERKGEGFLRDTVADAYKRFCAQRGIPSGSWRDRHRMEVEYQARAKRRAKPVAK